VAPAPDNLDVAAAVSAVVLAAGRASRMGEEKLLLPLGDRPVLRHVVESVDRAGMRETVVVVNPHNRDAITALVSDRPRRVVCNERFQDGIASSIAAGTRAISENGEALVLVQGDQPLVTGEMLRALVSVWRQQRVPFVAASYDGLITTPVLFVRALYPELRELQGDVGARAVLRRHSGRTVAFPRWMGSDLDTRADYDALQKEWSARHRMNIATSGAREA
jgi:molybdenum cofactor cytidylyltransferase